MLNDLDALRSKYVEARDALEAAENDLNSSCGELTKAIGAYVALAQDFLPKIGTGLFLRLPPLPDDFELLQLEDLSALVTSSTTSTQDFMVLCPQRQEWRHVIPNRHHAVVARRKKRAVHPFEDWANSNQVLTELHAALKTGADVRVEHVDGALIVCHGTCIYVLSGNVDAPRSDKNKLKAVYGDSLVRWVMA